MGKEKMIELEQGNYTTPLVQMPSPCSKVDSIEYVVTNGNLTLKLYDNTGMGIPYESIQKW